MKKVISFKIDTIYRKMSDLKFAIFSIIYRIKKVRTQSEKKNEKMRTNF